MMAPPPPRRARTGLHPDLLNELIENEQRTVGPSANSTKRKLCTSTSTFGKKSSTRNRPADEFVPISREHLQNASGRSVTDANNDVNKQHDVSKQNGDGSAVTSLAEKLRQERMVKYPDLALNSVEYKCIEQEMRDFIAEAPNTNSGWHALVNKFKIGYLQAKKMSGEIMRASPANAADTSAAKLLNHTVNATMPSKRVRQNGRWLSHDDREKIKAEMKPLLREAANCSADFKVDYNEMASRFQLSEAQAIDIVNETLYVIQAEPTREQDERLREQKRQSVRVNKYPTRNLSRKERRDIKQAMVQLPFDGLDDPLGNNKWIPFADQNRLNYQLLHELRREIVSERGAPLSNNGRNTASSSEHSSTISRVSSFGSLTPFNDDAKSSSSFSMSANLPDADTTDTLSSSVFEDHPSRKRVAALETYRDLALLTSAIERLFRKGLKSDEIAHTLGLPLAKVKDVILHYHCHLMEERFRHKPLKIPGLDLDTPQIRLVEIAVKRLPFATLDELVRETNLPFGAVRAILLHKLSLWSDDADLRTKYLFKLFDKNPIIVEESAAETSNRSGRWRGATAEEVKTNGFPGFEEDEPGDVSDEEDDAEMSLLTHRNAERRPTL